MQYLIRFLLRLRSLFLSFAFLRQRPMHISCEAPLPLPPFIRFLISDSMRESEREREKRKEELAKEKETFFPFFLFWTVRKI